jgi:hypothetical protein
MITNLGAVWLVDRDFAAMRYQDSRSCVALRWVTGDGVTGDGVTGDGVTGDGVTGDGVTGDGVTGDGVTGVGRRATG